MEMPGSEQYSENRCLIKNELDIHVLFLWAHFLITRSNEEIIRIKHFLSQKTDQFKSRITIGAWRFI